MEFFDTNERFNSPIREHTARMKQYNVALSEIMDQYQKDRERYEMKCEVKEIAQSIGWEL